MATTRDWDFVTDLHTPLSEVMTTDLETAQYGARVGSRAVQLQPAGQYGGWVGGQLGSGGVVVVHMWGGPAAAPGMHSLTPPSVFSLLPLPFNFQNFLFLIHSCRHYHRREGDAAALACSC